MLRKLAKPQLLGAKRGDPLKVEDDPYVDVTANSSEERDHATASSSSIPSPAFANVSSTGDIPRPSVVLLPVDVVGNESGSSTVRLMSNTDQAGIAVSEKEGSSIHSVSEANQAEDANNTVVEPAGEEVSEAIPHDEGIEEIDDPEEKDVYITIKWGNTSPLG